MKILRIIVDVIPNNCNECAFIQSGIYCRVKGSIFKSCVSGGQCIKFDINSRDENCPLEGRWNA